MAEVSIFLWSCAAGVCACLSMARHHRSVFGVEPSVTRRRALKVGAWASVAMSYGAAVTVQGPGIGAVEWVCALGFGAIAVGLVLPYKPHWMPYVGAAAAFTGAMTMFQ